MPDFDFSENSGFSFGFSESSPDDNFSFDINTYDDNITMNPDEASESMTYDESSGSDAMDAEMSGDPNIIGQHKHLSGRSLPDQHPMSAITGLLDSITSARTFASSEATAALNAAKSYADSLKTQTIEITEEMIRIQAADDSGRYALLRADVNELAAEVGIDGVMWTQITANAQAIALKANTADVNAQFEVQAGQISSKVSMSDFQSYVRQTADTIEAIIQGIDGFDPDNITNIWSSIQANADAITAEVGRASAAETSLNTRIQTAESTISTISRNATVVNLVPAVYVSETNSDPYEANGLTFKVLDDGRVKVTGQASSITNYYIAGQTSSNRISLDPLKDYVISGCPSGGGNSTFYLYGTAYGSENEAIKDTGSGDALSAGCESLSLIIQIRSGYECPEGGLIFSPQVEVDPGKANHAPSAYQSARGATSLIFSRITQTAEGIMSEVSDIQGDVESLTTWKQTADGFISTARTTLENLSAGSRNLLLNSATKHPTAYGSPNISFTDNVTVSEWNCSDAIRVSGTGGSYVTFAKLVGTSERNNVAASDQNYVFSVWIKNNRDFNSLAVSANGIMAEEMLSGGEMRRVVLKGSGDGSSVLGFHFETASAGGAFDFTFWHPKIERGNIVSDWSPAPEDVVTHIYESYIEQLSDKISLVVQETQGENVVAAASIVTAINNQQSSVKINADHISLTGYGTINMTTGNISIASTNFNVTSAGVITATNAIISGQITSSAGSIGGWTIDSEHIYREREIDGTLYRASLYSPETLSNLSNAAFYIGSKAGNNAWDYKIRLQYNGKLIARDAEIEGVISATSGVIGMNATNKITIGNNSTYASIYNTMTSLSDTTHDGFYLGADGLALGKGKFKVTSAGALTATSATIIGSVTATSGKIGGWTVESERFYSEATDENDIAYRVGFYAPASPSTGSRAIYVRQGSNDYQFAVYYSGRVIAKNADITGSISATSGYIGANAASRIVIGTDSSRASIYSGMPSLSSANNGFYIGTDGMALGGGKFKVTSAGLLNSISGAIGGWTIEDTRIYKEREDANTGTIYRAALYAPANPQGSNAAFYIGAQDPSTEEWDYKIRLQYNGKLIAKDAEIEGSITATSGSIKGSLVSSGINAAYITTGYLASDRIEAGSIATAKLAALAVTAAKIASGAITTDKLDASAVTAAKIASGAITTDKLAASAVTAAKIAAGAITADHIAANAITVGKIKAGEITADRINVSADARKTEWLTQINLAVSMALSDSQNFRIGNVRAYGYSDSLTFSFGSVGSGMYVRLYPAPKRWSDPSVPNAYYSVLIAFAGGSGETTYGLTTSGQIVAIGAEQ